MLTKSYRFARCLGLLLLSIYSSRVSAEGILLELDSLAAIRAQTHVTLRHKEEEKKEISRICTALQFPSFYLDTKIFENLTRNLISTYFLLDVLEHLDKFPPFCSSLQQSEPTFPAYTKPGVALLILDALEQKSNPYIYSPPQVAYMLHAMNCSLATTRSITQGLGHGRSSLGKSIIQEYTKVLTRISVYKSILAGG